MKQTEIEKIIQAGKIASETKKWIRPQIKKGTPLIEIAEKIESKLIELGAKPAFPTNLSINEIAAHYTPSHDDKTIAHGLLKIDLGAHIDGFISDTAFSLDLENSEENKNLIKETETALASAEKIIKLNSTVSEIGKSIESSLENSIPIINLSGHSIQEYDLHSGITIPNYNNKQNIKLPEGVYAVEPFATLKTASGKVKDSKPSGIYQLIKEKPIRNPTAREILKFIKKEYETLPFCSRWIIKKFGTISTIALRQLEEQEILHQFSQLIESSGAKVSQSENTFLVLKDKVINTTR